MSVFRAIFTFALVALMIIVVSIGIAVADDAPVKIVDIGDSYIVGYGIGPAKAFPTALQAALKSRGHLVEVIDTGYKNTSASGLLWLLEPDGQKLFAAPAGHAVVLELGGNDCSRFDVDKTRANLDQVISQLAKKHIPVLLVGTEPSNFCARKQGTDYPAAYRQIFPDLAKQYGAILYPDFKDGVSGHPELLQADNDHPNAAGEAIIVDRILPSVEALIAQIAQK
jgi:acyl-CoA thioesterase I